MVFRLAFSVFSLTLITILLLPISLSAQVANPPTGVTHDADLYYRMFHHVAVLKKIADTAQQQSKDRSNLRDLVRQHAGLSPSEGQILERVSLQCESAVSAQDAQAKAIIDKFHAQYPSVITNFKNPPKAPAELDSMWRKREEIILRARDSLRSELGEEAFSKLENSLRAGNTSGNQATIPGPPAANQR